MSRVPVISLLLSGLVLLTSCADPRYQVRQPLGYGEMPPGESWVSVESAYQSPARETIYFDPKTIRRDGDLVTLWQLTDYKWMQGNPKGPTRFLSTKMHKEFDCAHQRVRVLASSDFSQHMGTGIPIGGGFVQGYGQSVEPGSINHALWKVACGTS